MFYYTFNSKIGWITAISSDLGILRISLPEKSLMYMALRNVPNLAGVNEL